MAGLPLTSIGQKEADQVELSIVAAEQLISTPTVVPTETIR